MRQRDANIQRTQTIAQITITISLMSIKTHSYTLLLFKIHFHEGHFIIFN